MGFQVAAAIPCILGEGPVWDEREQALYWVDIEGCRVHRLEWPGEALRSWTLPDRVGALVPRERGGFVCAMAGGIALADAGFGALAWLGRPEAHLPGNRFNDGKCDRDGRFWTGTMDEAARLPSGALYRVDHDGSVTAMRAGVCVSNSLCWSPDGTVLYFADSPTRTIHRFDYNRASGSLAGEAVFARTPPGAVPDGATVDCEGFVWNAEWDGARLCRYAPDGRLVQAVELPVSRPTSCAFGGPDLATLFVTTARYGLTDGQLAAQPRAGMLLALRPSVRGIGEARFRG